MSGGSSWKNKVVMAVMFTVTALPGVIRAETSVTVDLMQELIDSAAGITSKKAEYQSLESADAASRELYEEAMALPAGTVDRSHAVGRFINARLQVLDSKIQTLNELEEMTDSVGKTLEKIARAVRAKKLPTRENEQRRIMNIARQSFGSGELIELFLRDPVLSRDPAMKQLFILNRVTYNNMKMNRMLQDKNPFAALPRFVRLANMNSALIHQAKIRLETQVNQLEMLHAGQTSSLISGQIDAALKEIFGTISPDLDESGDDWSTRYMKLMEGFEAEDGSSSDDLIENYRWDIDKEEQELNEWIEAQKRQ